MNIEIGLGMYAPGVEREISLSCHHCCRSLVAKSA